MTVQIITIGVLRERAKQALRLRQSIGAECGCCAKGAGSACQSAGRGSRSSHSWPGRRAPVPSRAGAFLAERRTTAPNL